jgi:hypothetical protein
LDAPPRDAAAGLALLLRHFYSPNERASFHVVWGLLNTEAFRQVDDHSEQRRSELTSWKKAEGRSRARSIQNQAIQRLIAQGRVPRDPDLSTYPDPAPPAVTISDYYSGDYMHWDEKADVVDERAADPFLDAMFRLAFFSAAAGLAHIYIGFAAVVDAAISLQGPGS